MKTIDLNCDMGEGMPNDDLLMPFISSANIACGYHAGDEDSMKRTVELCLENNVAIGVHPSFKDKENFGRTNMQLADNQLYDLIIEQVYILKKVCSEFSTIIHHIKPHGALYNMAAKDKTMSNIIAQAIHDIDARLILYGLSESHLIAEAKKIGLQTAAEIFADRTYQDDGSLTPRSLPNALIENEEQSIGQVLQMIQEEKVTTLSGNTIPIKAETLCIHGDGKHAIAFAKRIHQSLKEQNIGIKTIQ